MEIGEVFYDSGSKTGSWTWSGIHQKDAINLVRFPGWRMPVDQA